MAGISYVPGTWLGVVRSGTAVLLGPDTPPALVGALWNLLADRPAVHEVLHAVSNSSGGSLASIPSFGILDFTSSLRVFLRGDLELTVELPDGPVELNGRDVTTWNERRFALPGQCTLTLPGARATEVPGLPLGEGVVLLGSLTIAPDGGPAAVTAGPAAPAVVVDPAGTADMTQTAAETEPAATFAVPAQAPAEADTHAETEFDADADADADTDGDFPDATLVPEPEVSTETVFAVLDDETYVDVDANKDVSLPDDPSAAPASDMTSSYDHLWERTVMRNIEDAAVREDPEEDHGSVQPGQAPALEPAAEHPGLEAAPSPEQADVDGQSVSPGATDHTAGPDQPAEPVRPAAAVLIDSVPWRTGGAASPPAVPAAPPATPPMPEMPRTPDIPPAHAVQGTAPSGWPLAAPHHLPAPQTATYSNAPSDAGAADFDGDHDGQTVMKSSLAGIAAPPAPVVAAEAAEGPVVLARVCSQGHPNPPTRAQCAGCGGALLPDAVHVARPRLGRMRLSTGELVDLDQSLVIGRQPSVSRVQGGVMPRLVQVASPGGDISRSHVEVRLEGWHVMLCDLKATNGTVLVRDGQPPRRLAQNEMAILLDGDIAELGDNISLRFEEIP